MGIRSLAAAAVATLLATAAPAVAQPTGSKPDEPLITPATSKVPTIKVTTKKFGSASIGKKLSLGTLKKLFPKSKVSKVKAVGGGSGWRFENAKTGLVAIASPERIDIEAGPVEVHGVMIGDDGLELAGGNFSGAYCFTETGAKDVVVCNKDALSFRFVGCLATAGQDGSIAPTALKGCKVSALSWIAYAANRD